MRNLVIRYCESKVIVGVIITFYDEIINPLDAKIKVRVRSERGRRYYCGAIQVKRRKIRCIDLWRRKS